VLTPFVALYLPASQLSHPVFTPDTALYLPGPQLVQSVDSVSVEYFPASQLPHAVREENVTELLLVHAHTN
jgi:hypothetical protein